MEKEPITIYLEKEFIDKINNIVFYNKKINKSFSRNYFLSEILKDKVKEYDNIDLILKESEIK